MTAMDPGATFKRAEALGNEGDLEGAIRLYDIAININANYSDAYRGRGDAYERLGNRTRAIADYEMAIYISPIDDLAHFLLGKAFLADDRFDEAIRRIGQAIELNLDYQAAVRRLADEYTEKGTRHYENGLFTEAIKDLIRVTKLEPNESYAHANLALAYNERGKSLLERGKPDEAIKDFDAALSSDQNCEDAHRNKEKAQGMLGGGI